MWYRVFSPNPEPVSPLALAEHLHAAGFAVEPHFRGDDLGWTSGELRFAGKLLRIDRYLTTVDDIREDLNSFAAELESKETTHTAGLMRRVIQSQQLIAFQCDDMECEPPCLHTVQYLAVQSDGIYQIDGQGWFAATGELLVAEE